MLQKSPIFFNLEWNHAYIAQFRTFYGFEKF